MIADVLAYARARMKALGFNEWPDAFSYDGIPKNQVEKVFYLELGTIRGVSNNQRSQLSDAPFTIRLFIAPSGNAQKQRDKAIAVGDRVVADFIAGKNRLTQAGVKNVAFKALSVESIAKTNEAGALLKLDFSALVLTSTD